MSPSKGFFNQLWFRWKALNLPWRRRWLRGVDLAGNTFWEFKDQINANRLRRIVKYNPKAHYADVKLTPQWVQWLRHTRFEAPSISEQQLDEIRQVRMKQLAAEADARWAAKPSALDPPDKSQPQAALSPRDPAGYVGQTEPEDREGVRNAVGNPEEVAQSAKKGETKEKEPAPWQTQQSEEWQPAPWTPKVVKRR
ncbi:hypothetical protein K490DRAFT_31916 [Saccharata proteae CBS 121410]|uniref:NADH dehydrogenase [ubiquinone] 1 alpha subcomplex subunit n=1 Tax=Saccharata proteae CBS 121410 TaxID=1314787 RepID=A0A9P4M3R9_9PEZI|nr:hypothetical protein K490DRAFT_31916 [Saccharata proteae CBS 121410]